MNREERLDDPEESLRLALESNQAQIWTAIPGVVAAVDLTKQTVSVQPTIQGTTEAPNGNTTNVNLPVLVDVPLMFPRAGGFALTFPVKVGDEVLVVFASRCIDSWWQSGGVGAAAEARMHDLSDGFALLAPTSQPKKLSGVSAANVQLRDEAGSTFLEVTPGGKIKIAATAEIEVVAPAIKMTGNITLTGNITATGQMTQTGGMSIGGITFGSHKHTGVQPGSGTSGAPTN
jgi:hypothetical protein